MEQCCAAFTSQTAWKSKLYGHRHTDADIEAGEEAGKDAEKECR